MFGYSPTAGDVLLLEFPVWDRSSQEHHQKLTQRVARDLDKFAAHGLSPESLPQYWRRIKHEVWTRHETCWEYDNRIGFFCFVGEALGRVVGYRYWRPGSLSTPYVKWPRCRVPYQLAWIGKFYEGDPRREGTVETISKMRKAVEAELSQRYARDCWVDWNRWRPEPMITFWLDT